MHIIRACADEGRCHVHSQARIFTPPPHTHPHTLTHTHTPHTHTHTHPHTHTHTHTRARAHSHTHSVSTRLECLNFLPHLVCLLGQGCDFDGRLLCLAFLLFQGPVRRLRQKKKSLLGCLSRVGGGEEGKENGRGFAKPLACPRGGGGGRK